jgi:CxxC motif-containing protein (DUF1111 family)
VHCGKSAAWAAALLLIAALAGACDGGAGSELVPFAPDAGLSPSGAKVDVSDVPIDGISPELAARFEDGDRLFGVPLREPDGLGPLYIRSSCSACHTSGLRGPGFVEKMTVLLADGSVSPDQSKLRFGPTVRPNVAAGAVTPIAAPADATVRVTTRVGPAVLGRGYLEAVSDGEIERVASEQSQRGDAIHGRIDHVVYASESSADARYHGLTKGDRAIGRFGLKARVATLDDFTADALVGDMGMTSPLRPAELPNPDGLTDDAKPGIDVGLESVQKRADYMRMIAIPRRSGLSDAGRALFARAKCDVCHVPSLRTRADYPIAQLAGIDAPIYTDLLLHDMGDALADGLSGADGEAGPRDWRTPPLIGLRFFVTYLHYSRARSIDEAIELHAGTGSEANESVAIVSGFSDDDRRALLDFVGAL